jgi:hypothetical protein
MPCNLSIVGKNFEVDEFLSMTKLRGFHKAYKGQPRFRTKPNGEKLPYSYASVSTSKADFDNLNKQIKDTIRYLQRNKGKLSHISSTKGIQYATLDFGINLRIDRKTVLTQSDFFPIALVKLAGELGLGIELSIYPRDLDTILAKGTSKNRKKVR